MSPTNCEAGENEHTGASLGFTRLLRSPGKFTSISSEEPRDMIALGASKLHILFWRDSLQSQPAALMLSSDMSAPSGRNSLHVIYPVSGPVGQLLHLGFRRFLSCLVFFLRREILLMESLSRQLNLSCISYIGTYTPYPMLPTDYLWSPCLTLAVVRDLPSNLPCSHVETTGSLWGNFA